MHNSKQLLIMAGGASSRMKKSLDKHSIDPSIRHVAQHNHKCLIPVGAQQHPLLYYQLLIAKRAGVKRVFIITPLQQQGFIDFLNQPVISSTFARVKIDLMQQIPPEGANKPLGTADAIQQALNHFPSLKEASFVVMNGDNLYSVECLTALFSLKENQNALIGYDQEGLNFSKERIQKFALLKVNPHNYLTDIIEKPSQEEIATASDTENKIRVSMNIFKLYGPAIYPYLASCPIDPIRKEKELPTAVKHYLKTSPKGFLTLPFCEHVPDLTSAEDISLLARLSF